ncbi:MAG: hypothetical protein P1P76_00950 [Anaerolineales bacterium]|nr:hypothetical protein [Anaerolineales bacterium]
MIGTIDSAWMFSSAPKVGRLYPKPGPRQSAETRWNVCPLALLLFPNQRCSAPPNGVEDAKQLAYKIVLTNVCPIFGHNTRIRNRFDNIGPAGPGGKYIQPHKSDRIQSVCKPPGAHLVVPDHVLNTADLTNSITIYPNRLYRVQTKMLEVLRSRAARLTFFLLPDADIDFLWFNIPPKRSAAMVRD